MAFFEDNDSCDICGIAISINHEVYNRAPYDLCSACQQAVTDAKSQRHYLTMRDDHFFAPPVSITPNKKE